MKIGWQSAVEKVTAKISRFTFWPHPIENSESRIDTTS